MMNLQVLFQAIGRLEKESAQPMKQSSFVKVRGITHTFLLICRAAKRSTAIYRLVKILPRSALRRINV